MIEDDCGCVIEDERSRKRDFQVYFVYSLGR